MENFGWYIIALLVIISTLSLFVWSVFRKKPDFIPLADKDPDYCVPLADSEVPKELQYLVPKWRKLAATFGYTGPVAWWIEADFKKDYAPQLGHCRGNWGYLLNWNLQNDESTKKSIVFWIPYLIPESIRKTVEEQLALRVSLREQVELPDHHLKSFGSTALLSLLILSYFKLASERIPRKRFWTRTDDLLVDGRRLHLGDFGPDGLVCGNSSWIVGSYDDLGCFALGIELIP